jgi:predicted TIM-barrel fold metal-dependent hydrolase
MKIIDPHLHLFNLDSGQYNWLKPEHPPFWPDKHKINKSFNEQDLLLASPLTLAGFVHIEAGFNNQQPWQELAWLESHCQLPFKAIATIDLLDENFTKTLNKLRQYQCFIGGRHILDEQALSILANPLAANNLKILAEHSLLFEAQLNLTDSLAVALLAKQLEHLPELNIVINHAGVAPLNANEPGWNQSLKILSQFPNCWLKCSGWEMAQRNYQVAFIEQTVNQALNYFCSDKVMLASNFPLTLFNQSYQKLWQQYLDLPLPLELIEKLCFNNSKLCYQLDL